MSWITYFSEGVLQSEQYRTPTVLRPLTPHISRLSALYTLLFLDFVIKSALKLPDIQSMNVIWTKTMWKCLWHHFHTETTLWDSAVDVNACQSHSYPLYRKNIHSTGSLFGHKDAFLLFPFLITNQFNLLNGYKAGTTSWEIDQSMYSIQHHLFLLCSR